VVCPKTIKTVHLEDVPLTGVDDLMGNKVYGMSIMVPHKALEELCPKGLTEANHQQLADAMLDEVALPPGTLQLSGTGTDGGG